MYIVYIKLNSLSLSLSSSRYLSIFIKYIMLVTILPLIMYHNVCIAKIY